MIKIKYECCINCLSCYKVCPIKALGVKSGKVILERPENCISCGHCTSVCPQMAIMDEDSISKPGIKLEEYTVFSQEEVEKLITTRRSIRRYDNREVEKDKIERLLYLAGQAPTGGNGPKCGFLVVGPKGCTELEVMINKYYLGKPNSIIGEKIRNNGYKVLLGAPVLIGIYDVKGVESWEFALAAQNLVLAANGMGLGTCYNGIFNGIYRGDTEIKSYLKLPEEYEMKIFIVLGYPDPNIRYHHTIDRVQPKVIWVD
jgi:nitroreductase/NAD-dependent dihydropyrimidine dehydrogenase PreA subunit